MGHITSNSCNNTSKNSDDFCCNDLSNCEIQELKNVDTANLQEGDILIANDSGVFYNTPLCETPCITELKELIDAQTDDQIASEVTTDPTSYTVLTGGDVQSNLNEIDTNLQDLIQRIIDEENKLTVVSVDDVVGTNNILITYSDGSTETIDKPEFSASTDGSGLVTFDLNGTLFGPFDTGMHTVDTDTYGTVVSNGDGTATITFPDGTTATVSEGPHTVDTDTFASWSDNGDGTITVTFADGTTQVVPQGAHTVDTDTFSTIVDNGDGTVTVTYASGATATFATGPHTIDTDTFATMVDNGDGTTTVTFANGDTVTVAAAPDVDTFATQVDNGDGTSTITFADGTTTTVPNTGADQDTTYTFIANTDGSITVNGSDGSTFTGPANTVDTDTFASLSGQTITFANGDTLTVSPDTDDQVISSSNNSIIFTPTTQPDGQVDYDAVVNLFQDGGTAVPVPFNEVQPTLRDDCGDDLPKDTRVHTNLYTESFTSGGSGADATDVIATQADPILYSSIESHTFTNPHPCRTFQGSFTIDQSITARFPADGGYGRIATEYRVDGGAWVTANTEGNNHEPGDDGDFKEFQLIDPQIPMALAPGASKLVEVRTRVQILFPTATQQMELLARVTAIRGAFNAQ